MSKEKILVVDDEQDILELVRYNLEKEAFQVSCVASGEDALKFVRKSPPDLIVLDLMLPGVNGLDVCKILKNEIPFRKIPILMLSAKGEEADIVTGLELGAEDYVPKPFSPKVLLARIKTILRRQSPDTGNKNAIINFQDLMLHPGRHEVTINDKGIDLTLSEFRILHLLAQKSGWVFTRYQIVHAVHGEDYPVTDRSVDVQIVGLRKKLGDMGKHIETIRGVGYRFNEKV